MLLKAKVIGIGAAGNKAAIQLMKDIPELSNNTILVNSTIKDIPADYREFAIELKGSFKGCAKERTVANDIMYSNLKSGDFDYPADQDDAMTIIVTSSEGGTGSGASIMLAKYISSVYKSHVHFVIFTGFEDDARGLKNTVDLFKELDSSYTVECISNKKFLDDAHGNRLKAEELANAKFVENVRILLGDTIVESQQNIDESDLLKLVNTPGFMTIENIDLGKIKNKEYFNTKVIEGIDDTKSLTVEPTCKRLGTILNITDKEASFVDYSNEVLKERYGIPYESFSHIQQVHDHTYIQFIVSGLKMPIEDIEAVYNDFIKVSNAVDKTEDEFFSKEFSTDASDFDTLRSNINKQDVKNAKNSFFSEVEKGSEVNNKKKFVKMEDF